MTLIHVPVIDIAPYRAGDRVGARRVAQRVGEACRDIGFLVIAGHGMDPALVARVDATARAFFDLPLAEKMRVARPAPDVTRGYIPLEGEAVAASRGELTPGDLNESMMIGPVDVPEGRLVFPDLSVRDNLRLGALLRRDADIAADLDAMLDRFPRLRERADGRAGLLSGGEQQMLALARGLMARPRVLLLDEPSLGLAPQLVEQVFEELATLRDAGRTLLLVDQNAELSLAVADRGYVLERGRVVAEGPAATLLTDAALLDAYLGGARPKEAPTS